MVAADSTTDAEFAALDLLSQAEHGKDSQAMLAIRADSREEADAIYRAIDEEIGKAIRRLGKRSEYMLPSQCRLLPLSVSVVSFRNGFRLRSFRKVFL